jgi:hypothetical protein
LAGKKVQNSIEYIPDPFFGITLIKEVPNPTLRRFECPSSTDRINRVPVTFGENTVSACNIYLSFSDMANSASCQTLRQRIFELQLLTARNFDSIGIFGNASVHNTFDWIPIIQVPPTVPQVAEREVGKCTQLLTAFNVQFLFAPFGISSNPQLAIVGARFNYTMGEFQWRCTSRADCVDPVDPNSPATTPRPFQIKSTVSFVRVPNSQPDPYTPVPPRIYAELPSDVWYPFNIPT